jgi:hypothetical protein
MSFDVMVNFVCKELPHVKSWLYGGRNPKFDTENNKRYRELRTRFIGYVERPDSRILITSRKPLKVISQTSKVAPKTDPDPDATTTAISTTDLTDLSDQESLTRTKNDENTPQDPLSEREINLETEQKISNREVRSDRSVGQLYNKDMQVVIHTDKPTYEYLKQVNAYRCLNCRIIYSADTKDTEEGHPCNALGREVY